ncbi:MAG: type IV secretory system conjugative DNA transfer family protein, partial [Armatimonadota bacterium]
MRSNDENSITPIGTTDFRHRRDVFGIKKRDRRSHMYVIGKTGTGKSTLLKNMLIEDIRCGEGLALIDPHGDLADDILHYVPEERMEDVIFFNPADIKYPIAFNPLEMTQPEQRYLVASDIISIFKKIWPDYWGPRLEHILRYSLLTLLEYPGSTLLDLPRLLTDAAFRETVLESVKDQHVRDFWFLQSGKSSSSAKAEAISPILNKTGQIVASPYIRYILGQSRSTFDLRRVMDEGKILIANLSKGRIGEDTSSFLGAMLVSSIMLAATSRADTPEAARRPFHLYVDELQNFLTLAFADILSESRKYGLDLVLAHQYIAQLDEKVRSAIFGNVGTIISF